MTNKSALLLIRFHCFLICIGFAQGLKFYKQFDGNLTDPETGADQFVRVDVEIPADINYPPGTQLMNLHDYKMIMPIASGKNYSFYFDETAAGLGIQFQVGSLLNMSEYGSEIVLIEPAPPLLQLECENCVNGPLVANFGSSSPYENITLSQFTENENGNRILLNTEVFDSTKKNTFFTLSPGRLDYFQAYSTSKEGLNSSIVESVFRAQPLPLEDFYYNVTESTNTSVTVYWTPPPANETIYDYFEISVPGKFTVRMEKNETFITMDGLKNDFYTLNAWTKTNDPFPSHSSPKMLSVYLKPHRVSPASIKQNLTDSSGTSVLTISWDKPEQQFNSYRLSMIPLEPRDSGEMKEKSISPQKPGIIISDVTPGTINLMRLVTVRSVEGENLISYPTEFIALIDPSPVTGLVNLEKRIGTRSLIFQWNPPNGHFDNYFIQWESDPNCAQNHNESIIYSSESAKASMTTAYHSYKLENLHPFCEYDFIVSTQIEPKNEYETLNSTRFISSGVQAKGKTGEEPPRVVNPGQGLELNITNQFETYFIADFNVTNFSNDYGDITHFAIWVREIDDQENIENLPTKPGKTPKRWSSDADREWIAQWIDLKKLKLPQVKFLTGIEIGNTKTTSYEKVVYRNQKLKSGQLYQFSIAAYNSAGPRELKYSPPMTNMAPSNGAVIAATIIPISFVCIGAIFIGVYYYRRRDQYDQQPKNERTTADQINGFENNAFHMNDQHQLTDLRKSKVIQLVDFKGAYLELKQDSGYKFSDEFFELKEIGKDQSVEASLLPANRGKNRYTNILSYDKTRVKLNAIDDESDDNGSDYINANYIQGNNSKREFIATQGPLPATKEDFWRMAWEQRTPIIVALCQVVERGRIKCDHYWPYDNEPEYVSDIKLQMTRESTLPEWTEREFVLIKGEERREIKQFHFTVWPDNGVPSPLDPLVRFVRQVRHEMNRFPTMGPTIIHCSAGVGRTGTFVGIDKLLQDYKNKSYVDIFGMVYEMRMSRCLMVQTEMQYICLHELIYHLQTGRYSAGDDTDSSGGGGAEKLKFDAEDPENGRMDTRIPVEASNEAFQDTSSSSSSSITSDEVTKVP